MTLEDDFSDVIAKAMTGLEIGIEELAQQAALGTCEIESVLRGEMNEAVLRKISPLLNLGADALIALPDYRPAPHGLAGISRIKLPYRQWTVNAWIVQLNDIRLLFDTGFGANDVLGHTDADRLNAVFLTHSHEDHVGGVGALESAGARVIAEEEGLAEASYRFGNLCLEVVDLSGHASPAVGFFITGLERQIFVTGDSVFAGSMGRCRSNSSYKTAFATLCEAIEHAESDCILLPGHGPATTLTEEMTSNPFFACFH
ncbi:MAG: MBL fold metallo-hydrolase [Armatimonadetes bacterium]|nr:MBL fold metallo-hydrolase [Akkermansiaceae bacterium]